MSATEESDREFLAKAGIVCDGLPEIPRSGARPVKGIRGSGPEPEPEGVGAWPGILICVLVPIAMVWFILRQ